MDQTIAPAKDEGDGKDAPKVEGQSDEELLKEAKDRYQLADDYWSQNIKMWKEDAEFRNLNQWPKEVLDAREGRPNLVVDKCNQYVRQVVNDGRQNRPSVKVRPVDDTGDDDVATAYQGIIRHILDRSNADEAFDTALDHAAGNGFGYFRVLSEYAHKNTFNHELIVRRIRNPLAVRIDPNFQAADGSDMGWGFIGDDIPKDEYKKRFPNAKYTNWDQDSQKYGDGWLAEKVRVVEYYYKVETDRTMHLLADGTTSSDEEYEAALAAATETKTEPPPAIIETRNIPECEVRWCRLSGAEVLEKSVWGGPYIPIIPIFGNESDIGGTVTYSGLVRAAKDPQRLYNYMRSAFAETVALQPKVPFVAAEGQLEGREHEWETANAGDKSVLIYKPQTVDGVIVPPPQRQPQPGIPEGFARDMQLSEHDIQASMGMYAASVGQPSNEKSGRAIMARQREGDTATFHYQDNLNRGIRYLGRILVDQVPRKYDSKRVIRILGEDGKAESAEINPEQEKPMERIGGKTIYNLGVGTYDVSVAAGPSYTTKRQEAAEMLGQMVQADPQIMQIAGDIIVRAQDMPMGEELAERFKLMLPPPIQQAEQAKQQGEDPKVLAAIAPLKQGLDQAQQQIQAQDQALQQAAQENQKLQADATNKQVDVESKRGELLLQSRELDLKEREVAIAEFDAQTKRIQVTGTQASPEDVQQFVAQAMATMGEQTNAALGQFHEATSGSIQQIADAIAQMSRAHQQTQETLQGMAQEQAAPPLVERGPDGRAIAVRKGNRRLAVARGPDGRVAGLQ